MVRKKQPLPRPPLLNINMTQFKTKVPEWRCFVVCIARYRLLPHNVVAIGIKAKHDAIGVIVSCKRVDHGRDIPVLRLNCIDITTLENLHKISKDTGFNVAMVPNKLILWTSGWSEQLENFPVVLYFGNMTVA